jgi:hypothetical protein
MKAFNYFFVICVLAFSQSLLAVDVAYEGYFRTRANYFFNLDLNRDQSPNSRAFTDMRFRLNPSFFITDKVRIRSSLNFINGVLGDNPFRASAFNNPATSYNRLLDPTEAEAANGVGRSIADSTSSAGGGIYTPDGLVESSDLKPLQLRRVWAELDLPYGTLKIGRMPFDLGMGIYANAGDGVDQEVGTTRDRILFDTAFGPYYLRPGIGWLVEGALDQSADDFMEYFFLLGRKTDNQDISIYLGYNNQGNYQTTATTGSLANRGTHYWSFDFYFLNKFDRMNLMAELALFSGRAGGKDLLAINSAARAEWNLKPSTITTEIGFSSGTDAVDATNGDLKTIPFNRDYNVSLLLFEEAIPGGSSLKSSAGVSDGVATSPHSGALSNAIYGRVKLDYDAASFFQPSLNLLVPFAAKVPSGGSERFYGLEYDIITKWPVGQYFVGDLSFGHFLPMSFYDNFSNAKNHSAFLFRGGVTAKF